MLSGRPSASFSTLFPPKNAPTTSSTQGIEPTLSKHDLGYNVIPHLLLDPEGHKKAIWSFAALGPATRAG